MYDSTKPTIQDNSASPVQAAPSTGPGSPRTILVADDENHIRAIVASKIRSAGHTVIEARDGEEALELARQTPPDLIVTDLQMPFMSGLEMALHLKADPRFENTPLLMLTARGHILDKEVLAQTNIVETIAKPFGAKELLRRIEAILSGVRQAREAA